MKIPRNALPCKEAKVPTEFVPLLIQREVGAPDEIFFAAICGGCGMPIMDPTANASVVNGGDVLEVVSDDGHVKTSILSGVGRVFHRGCDSPANTPWQRVFPRFKEAA